MRVRVKPLEGMSNMLEINLLGRGLREEFGPLALVIC